jgi:hypothetical protein
MNLEEEQLEPRIFSYRIVSGLLVRNHLQFPVKVNGKHF